VSRVTGARIFTLEVHVNRFSKFAAVTAATTLAIGVFSATPASAATFYDPPADLPSGNGTVLRTEPMKLALNLNLPGGASTIPGKATRIMYKSTDQLGVPVAVTGAYIASTKKWTGKGERPLVAFGPGTQGQGDSCAPSKSLESLIHIENGEFGIGYEVLNIYDFLNRGVNVVMTDFVGMGTTDRVATYTNREDMGHSLLDAARAAISMPGNSISTSAPIGLYGYSQGGGAAGAAAELAPSYAPELNIKGSYVGAPPANLLEVTKSADGAGLVGVIAYAINGLMAYYPEAHPLLDSKVNQKGRDALEKAKTQCIGSTLTSFGFTKTSKWTKDGKSAYETVKSEPLLLKAVNDQRIGNLKPSIPVQVLTGTQDDLVDHGQVKQLAKDWCGKGVKVDYVPVIQPIGSFGTGLNHLGPAVTNLPSSHNWLMDRMAGKSATSNCGLLWLMP